MSDAQLFYFNLVWNNASHFSVSDLQLFSFNLIELVWNNAVVKAPIEYLELLWELYVYKDQHNHLPTCQIL